MVGDRSLPSRRCLVVLRLTLLGLFLLRIFEYALTEMLLGTSPRLRGLFATLLSEDN